MMRTRVHTLHSPEKGRKEGRKEGRNDPASYPYFHARVCAVHSLFYFIFYECP